jgi:hypothetical protein
MLESYTRKVHLVRTLQASAAQTATNTGTTAIRIPNAANGVVIVVDLTAAATDAGDLLDLYVQTKIDGTNWVDVYYAEQMLGNGGAKRFIAKLVGAVAQAEFENATGLVASNVRHLIGDEWRVRWTVTDAGADNASFTFSVTICPM